MNSYDTLNKLFGSPYRAKLLRLFIFNPGSIIDRATVGERTKIPASRLNSEINVLKSAGIIKERPIPIKMRLTRAKTGFELSPNFPLTKEIKKLLNADFLEHRDEIVRRFKNCGRIRLLIVSGIFVENTDSRVDLVIVGENLKRNVIERIIRGIEAEIGRELVYSIMEADDFRYRSNSSDKFIRDIFDYPHEFIIDKMPY
jgi:predicted nucleotidyltransferase